MDAASVYGVLFAPDWRPPPPLTPLRPDGHALIADAVDSPLADAALWPHLLRGPLPALSGRTRIGKVEMVAVTFLFQAKHLGPSEVVLLHLNTLTDRNREALEQALLTPLGDGWYGQTYWLPCDAVLSYAFVPLQRSEIPLLRTQRARWMEVRRAGLPDPLNPRRVRNGVGNLVSLWVGPDAEKQLQWEALELGESQAGPQVPSSAFQVRLDGESFRCVFQPCSAGPKRSRDTALLVLFDGEFWREAGVSAAVQMDILFIDTGLSAARANALGTSGGACELVRLAVTGLASSTQRRWARENVLIAGASLGGLAAANVVLHAPWLAATAVSLSPSLWVGSGGGRGTGRGELLRQLEERALPIPAGARLYVGVGMHEGETVRNCQSLVRLWQEAGASGEICFARGGHDYAWWRYALTQALRAAGV